MRKIMSVLSVLFGVVTFAAIAYANREGSMLLTVVAFVIYSFTAKAKRKKLPMAERKELVLSLLEA